MENKKNTMIKIEINLDLSSIFDDIDFDPEEDESLTYCFKQEFHNEIIESIKQAIKDTFSCRYRSSNMIEEIKAEVVKEYRKDLSIENVAKKIINDPICIRNLTSKIAKIMADRFDKNELQGLREEIISNFTDTTLKDILYKSLIKEDK